MASFLVIAIGVLLAIFYRQIGTLLWDKSATVPSLKFLRFTEEEKTYQRIVLAIGIVIVILRFIF